MNSIPSPPSSSSPILTQSKNPNYLFKFNLKLPILPFHSSSSHLTAHAPCCTLKDSTSVLDKNAPTSEQSTQNYIPPKDSNFDGTLVVRRPVKEFSGENSGKEVKKEKEIVKEEAEASSIDVGLTTFAKKMPIFEPGRVESDSKDKLLTVNLDLALYKAKVLARNFRYQEAEEMLLKVGCLMFPF